VESVVEKFKRDPLIEEFKPTSASRTVCCNVIPPIVGRNRSPKLWLVLYQILTSYDAVV
jgi:hypothetical protein